MKTALGKALFRISRFVLNLLGFEIKLGSSSVLYPELNEDEIRFVRTVFSQSLSMTSFESLCSLAIVCKKISLAGLPGDFVEVGVWRGGSSIVAKKFLSGERRFFLFDTFAGMTRPTENDFRVGAENNEFSMAKWEKSQKDNHNEWVFASLDEVKKNFSKFNLLDSSIEFRKGDVRETFLSETLPSKVSILRLDTDFYDSTLIELQKLWPSLVRGGILILDDYGHWDGARKAVDEYFQNQNLTNILMIPIAGGGGRLIIKS